MMRASTNVAWLVCIAAAAHGESNAHKLTRGAHAHTICPATCCMFCTMPATQCNFTAHCCARQLWTARSRGLCSIPKLRGSEFTCLHHPPTVGPCATSTILWIRCQQQCTSQPPNSTGHQPTTLHTAWTTTMHLIHPLRLPSPSPTVSSVSSKRQASDVLLHALCSAM